MPSTLLDWLVAAYPTAKRQTLKRMAQAGRVRVNGRPVVAMKHALRTGDKVTVLDRPTAPTPTFPNLRIIHEDAAILVVNKPAGLLTSTVPREKRATLWQMVCEYLLATNPRARPGLIHRLDRDAAGLLVFSKTDAAYQSLKTQFYQHTVQREYAAWVHGFPNPAAATIESRLIERADGTVHSTRQAGKGQIAITRYELVKSAAKRSLLRVMLETGRKHQIRVHLSERGWPIVGDSVYGPETSPDQSSAGLMLCAVRLTLAHPRTGRELTFSVEPPMDL